MKKGKVYIGDFKCFSRVLFSLDVGLEVLNRYSVMEYNIPIDEAAVDTVLKRKLVNIGGRLFLMLGDMLVLCTLLVDWLSDEVQTQLLRTSAEKAEKWLNVFIKESGDHLIIMSTTDPPHARINESDVYNYTCLDMRRIGCELTGYLQNAIVGIPEASVWNENKRLVSSEMQGIAA